MPDRFHNSTLLQILSQHSFFRFRAVPKTNRHASSYYEGGHSEGFVSHVAVPTSQQTTADDIHDKRLDTPTVLPPLTQCNNVFIIAQTVVRNLIQHIKKPCPKYGQVLSFKFNAVHLPSTAAHRRYSCRQLGLGDPAAHERVHLMLLPSGPDMVHGFPLRGTQTSTLRAKGSLT